MTNTIRLIIAGSRDFNNYKLLEKEVGAYLREILKEECNLDLVTEGEGNWGWYNGEQQVEILPPLEIVSGGARGADRLGEKYARERNYHLKIFNADWEKNGRSAGYIRNEEMAKYANYCICFNINRSKGSAHMESLAKKHSLGLKVINILL